IAAVGQAALVRRGGSPGGAAVGGNLVGDADAVEVAVGGQAEVEGAVLGDRRRVGVGSAGRRGRGQSPGDGRRVVDDHGDRVAGGGVARRVGGDGVELIAAVGQAALVRRGGSPGGAAVGGNLVGDADAVEVAVGGEAEVEGAVLGDRRRVGAAGVGQVGNGRSHGGGRGVVDDHGDRVAGGSVPTRRASDLVELIAAVGQAALVRRGGSPGGAAVGGNLVGDADAVEVAVGGEAEVEGAVLGDRRRVGAAGVGQV